jgi:hypothetical protein
MIGEISIGGIYFPALLILGLAALGLTALVSRWLAVLAVYRFFASRVLVDGALFVIFFGSLEALSLSMSFLS